MNEERAGIKARLLEETKTMLILFVYLSVFFGAFTMYGRLMLAEYGIPYLQYGYNFVEALVLSKVILLGQFLRLGERFNDRPLIVPTLYKTLWFGGLILAFSIFEHLLVGRLHGESNGSVVQGYLNQGLPQILAHTLVKALALVPLFAVTEIGRVVGAGNLFELFFRRRTNGNFDASGAFPLPRSDVPDAAVRPADHT